MTQPTDLLQSQSRRRPRLLTTLLSLLALTLLAAATLPLSGPAISPEPANAEFESIAEEASEEEWELEEAEDEDEEELTANGSASLPPECLLRSAEPNVTVQLDSSSLRLVLRYTARTPTKVGVDYWLKGGKGSLQLGSVTRHVERQGALHLSRRLDEHEAAKVRAARTFIVDLDVPAAPAGCERYLTLRLGAKDLDRSRVTWSERRDS